MQNLLENTADLAADLLALLLTALPMLLGVATLIMTFAWAGSMPNWLQIEDRGPRLIAHLIAWVGLAAPRVVLLDLGLPDIDGLELCARIRGESSVPIIILTARGAEYEKITALEGGTNVTPFPMPAYTPGKK